MSSAVREPISLRAGAMDPRKASTALPLLWAAFLTLLIGGPWLAGGYIFGTDWPGPRRFDSLPVGVSSAPLGVTLRAISWLIAGEATGKLFVFGLLFVAAATAYRSVPMGGFVARAAAATVYLVNPFVYGRLHYGQLFLLAAYAVLPWVALRLRLLLIEPRVGSAVLASVSFVLIGILSPHLFLVAMFLTGALIFMHVIAAGDRFAYLKRLGLPLLLTLGLTLAASSYWLVPLLLGRGSEGSLITGVGIGDLAAYAAIPDPQLGLLPNLMGLYGFWAEDTGRFTSMKHFVPLWPVVLTAILLICTVGAVAGLRQRRDQLKPWVGGLLVAAVITLILEAGVSHPLTSGLVRWLDANFAPYRGMRDAGKWAVLLALVYSQLVGLGAVAILDRLRKPLSGTTNTAWIGGVATGLLIALPLYYGNGLLFGMHGEIKTSPYPSGWYAADRALMSDSHPGRTLFLPWHEYMSFSFVRNQNTVAAPPAPTFFSTPMLVSANPEVPGIAPPSDPDQVAVSILVTAGDRGPWAEVLAAHGIKYVLLAREVDWNSYRFLDTQAGLVKIGDYGSIVLYRNTLVN